MAEDLLAQLGIYPGGDGSGEGTGSVHSRGLAPGTEYPPHPSAPAGAPESHTAVQVAVQPAAPTPAFGKIAQPDSSYVVPGPAPFICGCCIFYLPGACQLVDGEIDDQGSCRFFKPIPPQAGMVTPGMSGGGEYAGPGGHSGYLEPAAPSGGLQEPSDGWGMAEPTGGEPTDGSDRGWEG